MVKINNQEFGMDGYLKNALDKAKEIITQDWDATILVDGRVGSGKSTLVGQMAYYCDPTYTLDRCYFKADEFKEGMLKAKPRQAIVFDEAFRGLASRDYFSVVNRDLNMLMTEIRQRNLFIFIVLPSIFDLEKSIALHRGLALIHTYPKDFQRGYFSFYDYEKKKELYLNGKKFYQYNRPKPNFIGRFPKFKPYDEEEYRKKKNDALQSFQYEDKKYNRILRNLVNFEKLSRQEKKAISGLSPTAFNYQYNKFIGKADPKVYETMQEQEDLQENSL